MNREVENVLARAPRCSWRYYLCAAAATAGAILCHAACEPTALATTDGLGIYACLLSCCVFSISILYLFQKNKK